jgi:diguanylate cyclase (GGDEF)-like protein
MTERNYTLDIANICYDIDSRAAVIYQELASLTEDEDLKRFWLSMSDDEKDHMDVWRRIASFAEEGILPEVFTDPAREKEELEIIRHKVDSLLERFDHSPSIANMFTLAYRLEFYVMHPAFEKLFGLMETLDAGYRAEHIYEAHMEKFTFALKKYGADTPELDLLGETLFRLWGENRKLAVLSSTDELTGLNNRRGFFNAAKPLLHLAQRNGNHVSFIICDLDDFKKINDTYGHQAGDRILKQVASIMQANVRASDIIGRYGGEEFIICFSTIGKNSVLRLAENIREAVGKETIDDIPVTISIGIAGSKLGIDVETDMDELIRKADSHMYLAKAKGKNQVMSDFSHLESIG